MIYSTHRNEGNENLRNIKDRPDKRRNIDYVYKSNERIHVSQGRRQQKEQNEEQIREPGFHKDPGSPHTPGQRLRRSDADVSREEDGRHHDPAAFFLQLDVGVQREGCHLHKSRRMPGFAIIDCGVMT